MTKGIARNRGIDSPHHSARATGPVSTAGARRRHVCRSRLTARGAVLPPRQSMLFARGHEPSSSSSAAQSSSAATARRRRLLAAGAIATALWFVYTWAAPHSPNLGSDVGRVSSPSVTYECDAGPAENGDVESGKWQMCCPADQGAAPPASSVDASACDVEFVGYLPSEYERNWLAAIEQRGDRAVNMVAQCDSLMEPAELEAVDAWMSVVGHMAEGGVVSTDAPGIGADTVSGPGARSYAEAAAPYLSRMQYRATCRGDTSGDTDVTYEWSELVEPLHPMGRSPPVIYHMCCNDGWLAANGASASAGKWCWGDKRAAWEHLDAKWGRDIMDVQYLLMESARQPTFQLRHAGARHLLFDGGSAFFGSSLRWILCHYRNMRGIDFDEVYAWEYEHFDQAEYWSVLPPEFRNAMHYNNVPVTADAGARHNPVALLKRVAKPRDYVAFKLDIDTPGLEIALINQILDDPEAAELVDELMFEYHFYDPIMRYWWHESMGTEVDSLEALRLFGRARQLGIRMHFWP